jgi:putative autotransporter adhesin-like protein
MRLATLFAAAIVLTAVPALASAATVVPVDKFNAVELHGGGTITIKQGPVQRVTVIEDTSGRSRVEVDGGTLILSPCRDSCWGSNHFEVEVETPTMSSVVIKGGGHILAEGAFAPQGAVSAVIHGGGSIDLKAMPAQSASAAIHGGGKIVVTAQNSLSAEIMGGGSIRYLGRPSVSTSIHGGGSVDPVN